MRPAAIKIILISLITFGWSGCVDITPELVIRTNAVLPDSCQVDASLASAALGRSRGVLDVLVRDSYSLFPQIQSTLAPSGTVGFGGPGGVDGSNWPANAVTFSRAEVSYDLPEGIGVDLPTRAPDYVFTGFVEPLGTAVTQINIIEPQFVAALRDSPRLQGPGDSILIRARVRVFGTTNASRNVDSNEFVYPIEICYGCLLDFPSSAIDPTAEVVPNCRNTEGFDPDSAPCLRGQDDAIDCRLVCPALLAAGDDEFGVCE